jgi:hypothetical protein
MSETANDPAMCRIPSASPKRFFSGLSQTLAGLRAAAQTIFIMGRMRQTGLPWRRVAAMFVALR